MLQETQTLGNANVSLWQPWYMGLPKKYESNSYQNWTDNLLFVLQTCFIPLK